MNPDQPDDHRPAGTGHAAAALESLHRIDRGLHSTVDPIAARVHAVLAVADAVADLTATLADPHTTTCHPNRTPADRARTTHPTEKGNST